MSFNHDDDDGRHPNAKGFSASQSTSTSPGMKVKLSSVGTAAVRLLEALNAAADANPILKSAAGSALHFAKLVEVRCIHDTIGNYV